MPFNRWSVPSRARSTLIGLLASVAALVAATGVTPAQEHETVLHTFKDSPDGANPLAGLISDRKGALYGTTWYGGSYCEGSGGCGTVFKLTPIAAGMQWTESVLYSFQGYPADGQAPWAGLIFDQQGALYGTTSAGGSAFCQGGPPAIPSCGTVFKLTPPAPGETQWTETVLYSFCSQTNCNDGAYPIAGLIFDQQGALYGTTYEGGPTVNTYYGTGGTVFKLTPPAAGQTQWTESVLYTFAGYSGDGAFPWAGLIFDQQGALYGTTTQTNGCTASASCGTVFKLTPPAVGQTQWTETMLYSFCSQSNCSDGAGPFAGLIFDSHGALYGTTRWGGTGSYCGGAGCGTVFKLTPPGTGQGQWTETVLYSFCSRSNCSDGVAPYAGSLIFDQHGALYGTTSGGGIDGIVFKLTPPSGGEGQWIETVLHRFQQTDGSGPDAGLIWGTGPISHQLDVLYGTTLRGGTVQCPTGECGTVFRLTLPPVESAGVIEVPVEHGDDRAH